jgi:hypothetical protein
MIKRTLILLALLLALPVSANRVVNRGAAAVAGILIAVLLT